MFKLIVVLICLFITTHTCEAAVLRRVWTGIVSFTSEEPDTYQSVPILPNINDLDKAFVVSNCAFDGHRPEGQTVRLDLNETHVDFTRSNGVNVMRCTWYVAEFVSGVLVRRGIAPGSAMNTPLAGGPVTPSKSFLVHASASLTYTTWSKRALQQTTPASPVPLTLSIQDTNDFLLAHRTDDGQYIDTAGLTEDVYYQVVQYDDCHVYTGYVLLSATEAHKMVAVDVGANDDIDPAKAMLTVTARYENVDMDNTNPKLGNVAVFGRFAGTLNAIIVGRNFANGFGSKKLHVRWQVIMFTDETRVFQFDQSLGQDSKWFMRSFGMGLVPPIRVENAIAMTRSLSGSVESKWTGGGGTQSGNGDRMGLACVMITLTDGGGQLEANASRLDSQADNADAESIAHATIVEFHIPDAPTAEPTAPPTMPPTAQPTNAPTSLLVEGTTSSATDTSGGVSSSATPGGTSASMTASSGTATATATDTTGTGTGSGGTGPGGTGITPTTIAVTGSNGMTSSSGDSVVGTDDFLSSDMFLIIVLAITLCLLCCVIFLAIIFMRRRSKKRRRGAHTPHNESGRGSGHSATGRSSGRASRRMSRNIGNSGGVRKLSTSSSIQSDMVALHRPKNGGGGAINSMPTYHALPPTSSELDASASPSAGVYASVAAGAGGGEVYAGFAGGAPTVGTRQDVYAGFTDIGVSPNGTAENSNTVVYTQLPTDEERNK